MMEALLLGMVSALWLGILTSVSPCPLASNIAAVSFISRDVSDSSRVFKSAAAYTLGRVVPYIVLGFLISYTLLNVPAVSFFLQQYVPMVVGPVLIITGLFLLEVFSFSFSLNLLSESRAEKIITSGLTGSFFIGVLFALAFCPVSAALFFGSLIPVSLSTNSAIAVPFIYGVGTGLPVLIVAMLLVFGFKNIGTIFSKITKIEFWARRITASVLIVIGIYYIVTYIFSVQLL